MIRTNLCWLILAATMLLALPASAAAATSGTLDPSFGPGGIVTEAVGDSDAQMWDVHVQRDGRIVSVGRSFEGTTESFAVTRHLASGSRDTTFGSGGLVELHVGTGGSQAYAVDVAPDGSVWLAGSAYGPAQDFAVIKLRPDGTLDPSFGGSGKVVANIAGSNDMAQSIAVQPDGRVLVAGYATVGGSWDFVVARFLPDGSLDTSFSGDGWTSTDLAGTDIGVEMSLLPSGKVLVSGAAGTGMGVVRYLPDGSLDPTFGTGGKVVVPFALTAYAYDVQPLDHGDIALVGYAWNPTNGKLDPTVVRLRQDGSREPGFGDQGVLRLSGIGTGGGYAYGAVVDPEGDLLISGVATNASSDAFVARVLPAGRLDTSWGSGGVVTIDRDGGEDMSLCLGMDAAGNAVVCLEASEAGSLRWGLARITNQDRVAPGATSIATGEHRAGAWSTVAALTATFSAADRWSGIAGYSWIVDQQPSSTPDAAVEPAAPTAVGLTDGDWYVHARAVDRAGNVGAVTSVGPFRIDTQAPRVLLAATRSTRRDGRIALSSTDAGSGVVSLRAEFRGKNVPIRDGAIRIGDLDEGRGTLVVTSRDAAGHESVRQVRMLVDRTAPTIRSAERLVLGPTASVRVSDAVSGVERTAYRVPARRLGRNQVTFKVVDRAGNRAERRVVVVRRLSLARPSMNRGLRLPRRSGDSISAARPWVNNAFRFTGYEAPWYAREDHGGTLVREAQWRLQEFGYLSKAHRRTGVLDLPTIRAVQRYQAARKLPVLGTIGPRTRRALDQDVLAWGRGDARRPAPGSRR